ncbi:MAG: MFS transporter [Opitutaceae bacterium]|jgi:GPH family glycoside/pentoside/hexuronide:cation symporter|nr:MFS transporter [Opitutaceae bacterium]
MSIAASSPHAAYTAPRRHMWLWGIGTIADALMIQTFGLIMPIFNTGFGLDAVLLSWAIMIPRLVDGLTDPFMGHLSDNLRTRWGRRKPFLVVTSILGAMVVAGIWWADPSWPKSWQFAYLVVFATLYYTTWGTFSMSHYALGYELTDDYHERARVMAIRTVFLQFVVLAVSWTYWLALRPVFGGEINGIRWIGGAMAVLIIVTGLVPVFACKERFAQANRKHPPILQSMKEAFRLPAFRTYIALRFFAAFGLVVFNQLIFYVNVYHVCAGDKSLATKLVGLGTMLTVGISVAILPLVPRLSRRMGKRNAVIAGCAIALLQACVVPLLYNPAQPYLQLVAAALTAPLVAIAIVLRDAIVPDICDLDELESGLRREGLFTAVVSFVYKLEVSLCVVLVGYMLKYSAFDPKLPLQSPEVLARLQWSAFLPNIVFAALALVCAVRFPVTEQVMREVRAKLDARRAAAPAA